MVGRHTDFVSLQDAGSSNFNYMSRSSSACILQQGEKTFCYFFYEESYILLLVYSTYDYSYFYKKILIQVKGLHILPGLQSMKHLYCYQCAEAKKNRKCLQTSKGNPRSAHQHIYLAY